MFTVVQKATGGDAPTKLESKPECKERQDLGNRVTQ